MFVEPELLNPDQQAAVRHGPGPAPRSGRRGERQDRHPGLPGGPPDRDGCGAVPDLPLHLHPPGRPRRCWAGPAASPLLPRPGRCGAGTFHAVANRVLRAPRSSARVAAGLHRHGPGRHRRPARAGPPRSAGHGGRGVTAGPAVSPGRDPGRHLQPDGQHPGGPHRRARPGLPVVRPGGGGRASRVRGVHRARPASSTWSTTTTYWSIGGPWGPGRRGGRS